MRTCRRFESNEVRQRYVSNGPKGEAKPSNPARPTISDKTLSAERRFFVFVLHIKFVWDENLPQVRVERSETTLRKQRPEGRGTAESSRTTHHSDKTLSAERRFFVFVHSPLPPI